MPPAPVPTTPTTQSITDFIARNSIPSAHLASTYRRNTHGPAKPLPPLSHFLYQDPANDSPRSSSTASTPDTTFWSPVVPNSENTSISEIAAHLDDNAKTPSRVGVLRTEGGFMHTPSPLHQSSVVPTALRERDLVNVIDSNTAAFTPIERLPSSVSTHRGKYSSSKSSALGTELEAKRRKVDGKGRESVLGEIFPKLYDSLAEMGEHPAYDVSVKNDRVIRRLHKLNEEFGGDKENMVEIGTPVKHVDFEKSSGYYSGTHVKSILQQRKLDMMKRSADEMEQDGCSGSAEDMDIERFGLSSSPPPDAWGTPEKEGCDLGGIQMTTWNSRLKNAQIRTEDGKNDTEGVDIDTNFMAEMDISTPETRTPALKPVEVENKLNPPPFELPQVESGLKSKKGLLSKPHLREASKLRHSSSPCPNPVVRAAKYDLSSASVASPFKIPPTPLPQKLIHKTAKEKIWSEKKLEGLKTRFPKNRYIMGKHKMDWSDGLESVDWTDEDLADSYMDMSDDIRSDDTFVEILGRREKSGSLFSME